MKILYLLFGVVFLMLMSAPGFSEARLTPRACKRKGGRCYFRRCPSNSIYLRRCLIGYCCQRQIFD